MGTLRGQYPHLQKLVASHFLLNAAAEGSYSGIQREYSIEMFDIRPHQTN
jgi:hypothetical protein